MNFRIRGRHGESWARRTRSARPPVRYPGVLQAPGMPAPEPLPQRAPAPPWDQGLAAPAQPEPGYRQLPSVTELAEQVTQQMPAVRRAPQTQASARFPDFRLQRLPVAAAVAALPKVTYPPPLCPLADYDGVMQVVSVLTGTTAEPDVWIRPEVEPAVTSDREIAAWERHHDADLRRRLAAAQRQAFAGAPS
jgi:hypothetical protein